MLKSNRIAFILALIMAISLWAYVLGEVDPVRTVTLRDIPIRLMDQTALTENGLVITDMDHEEISVTFSAKRSLVNKIDADDFHATADMRDVKLGNNVVMITLTKPSNITLESVSSEYLNITTEQFVTETKPIEVMIINPTEEETEPTIINISEDKVDVSGASTAVNKVKTVVAELDASRMDTEPKSISATLKAVDENGDPVEGVSLEFSNVTITAVMQNTRTLPLNVPIIGLDSGSISRTISYPDTITIKGDDEAINSVESISCESLDLSDCYESGDYPLIPVLPEGAELSSDSENLSAQVTVYNAGTATITFDETDINVTGIGKDRSANISDAEIKVTVKGISTVISALTKDNFVLTADVTDLEDGTNYVKLAVTCNMEGVDKISASPESVEIELDTI